MSNRFASRSTAFAVALVGLVVAGIGLAYVGIVTVRDSTAGKRFDPKLDPAQPGFEAIVTPTPTMLVVHADEGTLVGVTLLALSNGDAGGGTAVFVPPATIGAFGRYGPLRLDLAYERLGAAGVRMGLQNVLSLGIAELVETDDARWSELVAPVTPLRFENPDDVPGFPAGPVALDAVDVPRYLEARSPGETDLERMVRHEVLWQAWLRAIAARGAAGVAGEVDTGLGSFLATLADGTASLGVLPVDEGTSDDELGGEGPAFQPRQDEVAAVVAAAAPYPAGQHPGARTRVRLLSGTRDTSGRDLAARALVAAGAEITIIGNADRFGYTETTVRYDAAGHVGTARRLAAVLGGAKVVREKRGPGIADVIDMTIVLGTDYDGAQEDREPG